MDTATLESICSRVSSGGTPSRKRAEYFTTDSTGHLWVKSKELLDGSIHDTEEKITDEGLNESAAKYFPPNTVLVAMYGANVGQLGWLRRSATVNQAICGLVVDEKKADWRFVFYSLLQNRGDLTVQAQGAAQQNLNQDLIRQFPVTLPPLPVQWWIAGILSAYDALMENNQQRIRILEAMARALYREWFVEFRFPGHEKLPRVVSPLGDIPQGWEVKRLESLMADHIGGGWGKETSDDDHTEPAWVIRGTDIPDARSSEVADVPHRFHSVSNLRTRCLQAGDILFEVSGGSKGQPVGRTLLVTPQLLSAFGDDAVICASFCKRIRPDASGYGSELLYLSFLEGYESGEIEQFQVQSTGISNFKWTEYVANTRRVIPPEPLRVSFRERVTPLFSQIATLGLQIQILRRTRDLLLPRLLSGQQPLKPLDP
jgi:type I restriction enzyme, S subunit